jgi:hypothetical protein
MKNLCVAENSCTATVWQNGQWGSEGTRASQKTKRRRSRKAESEQIRKTRPPTPNNRSGYTQYANMMVWPAAPLSFRVCATPPVRARLRVDGCCAHGCLLRNNQRTWPPLTPPSHGSPVTTTTTTTTTGDCYCLLAANNQPRR